MIIPKNPPPSATPPSCSAAPPPSTPSSTHSPMPLTPSSKLAADLQPMDLDHTKSKNPPLDLLQLEQARAHHLELSGTPHTLSVQCRPPVSGDHLSNRGSHENCCWR